MRMHAEARTRQTKRPVGLEIGVTVLIHVHQYNHQPYTITDLLYLLLVLELMTICSQKISTQSYS